MDDHQCFTNIHQGSVRARRAAVDCLYQRYAARLHGYLQRRGISLHDAQDIVQNTFIRLLEPLPEPVIFPKAYLYKMLNNRANAFWKESSKAIVDSVNTTDFQIGQMPDAPLTQPMVDAVYKAFAAFTRDHPEPATALELVVLEGFGMKELAQFLGKSEGATREYVSFWRRKFRQDYQDYLGLGLG